MQDYQHKFLEFVIDHQILKFGEFKLKSGRLSPYFFNAGLFNSGNKLSFLADSYAQAIVASNVTFDVLFGPAYKGIPLVATTAIALSKYHNLDKPYCFNRKEVKKHGEKGLIVGSNLEGRVLILDDVITAGTAIREVAEVIKDNNAIISGITVALDRQEKGLGDLSAIQEIEHVFNISVVSIINLDNIVNYLSASDDDGLKKHTDSVTKYRDTYGV